VDFDLQPYLVGELVELRPLRPEHWDSLYAVASDPLIWAQHPATDRYKEEVFREFFREALESRGAFVVLDRKTQRVIGSSRYFGFDREKREIEIGWTFLARSHWGGRYNGEMKRLMLITPSSSSIACSFSSVRIICDQGGRSKRSGPRSQVNARWPASMGRCWTL
jgi:hypothetical protein